MWRNNVSLSEFNRAYFVLYSPQSVGKSEGWDAFKHCLKQEMKSKVWGTPPSISSLCPWNFRYLQTSSDSLYEKMVFIRDSQKVPPISPIITRTTIKRAIFINSSNSSDTFVHPRFKRLWVFTVSRIRTRWFRELSDNLGFLFILANGKRTKTAVQEWPFLGRAKTNFSRLILGRWNRKTPSVFWVWDGFPEPIKFNWSRITR